MREFRGHEYVDGDVRIYAQEEGQDDAWAEVGVVPFDDRHRSVMDIAERLGLENMDGVELARLNDELVMPKRH